MNGHDGILNIDNSTLRATANCSTQALMRYGYGYTTLEERATLRSGTAFHEAAEAHFKGASPGAALAVFEQSYREWAEENVALDDRLSYANTSRIVGHWLDSHPLNMLPFRVHPELIEVGFAYPLTDEGDIVFCGRMDGIVTWADGGGLYVLEHKTTGRVTKDWLSQFSLDSQLSGYIWAAQQHTSQPVIGAFLNAVEFSKLPGSDRKCATHAVQYAECGHLHATQEMVTVTRTPEMLVEWRKSAISIAKRYRDLILRFPDLAAIHKVRMTGMFNGSCRWCAFADWCRGGRQFTFVDANFTVEPWEPYERAAVGREHTAHLP